MIRLWKGGSGSGPCGALWFWLVCRTGLLLEAEMVRGTLVER